MSTVLSRCLTRNVPFQLHKKTYTRVIARLFSNKAAISHAHAWGLFSHMRYVAHLDLDGVLYTAMIRACVEPSLSVCGEPERAVDLWTEV